MRHGIEADGIESGDEVSRGSAKPPFDVDDYLSTESNANGQTIHGTHWDGQTIQTTEKRSQGLLQGLGDRVL